MPDKDNVWRILAIDGMNYIFEILGKLFQRQDNPHFTMTAHVKAKNANLVSNKLPDLSGCQRKRKRGKTSAMMHHKHG
ncbi:hypothetical protein BGX24_004311 [Mortierella sp. AD032]|nr:hypothetical protein BGX24_004311 [Mortierella sp. AD032]